MMEQKQNDPQMQEMLNNRSPGHASTEEVLRAYAIGAQDSQLIALIDSLFSSNKNKEELTGNTLYKPYPPIRPEELIP